MTYLEIYVVAARQGRSRTELQQLSKAGSYLLVYGCCQRNVLTSWWTLLGAVMCLISDCCLQLEVKH